MTASTRERKLTPPEISDRTPVLLALLDDQDAIRLRVRASRDELREWRVEARNLALQIDQVRQEIRTGIVTEPAQMTLPNTEPAIPGRASDMLRELRRDDNDGIDPEQPPALFGEAFEALAQTSPYPLGIDGSSDEPDEETDPPPPAEDPKVNAVSDHELLTLLGTLGVQVDLGAIQSWSHRQLYYAKLWALAPGAWPRPEHFPLLDAVELRHLITCVRPKAAWPSVKAVESWHEQVRFDVQRWCRIEHARNGHIAGHPMPVNGPMPSVLANLEPGMKKPAKAAKKKRTRKAAA